MHSINKGVILQPQPHFWGATGHGVMVHGITRIGPQSTGIMRVGPQSTGSRESDHGPRGQVHGVTRVRPWATGSRSTGSRGSGHGPRGHEGWVTVHGVTRVRCDCSGSACRLAYCNWRSSENQSQGGQRWRGGDTQLGLGRGLDTALHARSQQSGQPLSLLALGFPE